MTGTGNAASFAYTKSVIEYASAADLAAVNTLKQQLTNVTTLQDSSLTPGTVELILGSDFTGLAPDRAELREPQRLGQPQRLREPRRLGQPQRVRLGRRQPGPVQQRHHRGGQLRQRQLSLRRPAQPLSSSAPGVSAA